MVVLKILGVVLLWSFVILLGLLMVADFWGRSRGRRHRGEFVVDIDSVDFDSSEDHGLSCEPCSHDSGGSDW